MQFILIHNMKLRENFFSSKKNTFRLTTSKIMATTTIFISLYFRVSQFNFSRDVLRSPYLFHFRIHNVDYYYCCYYYFFFSFLFFWSNTKLCVFGVFLLHCTKLYFRCTFFERMYRSGQRKRYRIMRYFPPKNDWISFQKSRKTQNRV